MPSYTTSWRFILILSSHLRLGLPSDLFPSGFPTKTLLAPLISPIGATYHPQINSKSYNPPKFTASGILGFPVQPERIQRIRGGCDTIARNKSVLLDIQKKNYLQRKGARHSRGRYVPSVLTFWACLYMRERMNELQNKGKNKNIIDLHSSINKYED